MEDNRLSEPATKFKLLIVTIWPEKLRAPLGLGSLPACSQNQLHNSGSPPSSLRRPAPPRDRPRYFQNPL
jgi:hypothetical protein